MTAIVEPEGTEELLVLKKFVPGRGYTKQDWDAVDSPELTDEQLSKPLAFEEAFPGFTRSRGRPRVPSPKAPVTLRLDPATVARFEAAGPNWRRRMADILDKSKP
jgi:uncharacterized protein (DUF4415 family)